MKIRYFLLAVAVLFCLTQASCAAEHGGKEHGGATHEQGDKEHGGKTQEHGGVTQEHGGVTQEHGGKEHGGANVAKQPSADEIRRTMKNHVLGESAATGTFEIYDAETGVTRKLALVRVHERVGKTGDYYYSCADFTDVNTGEFLDLDLDVENKNGKLSVVDVRVHKLNGKERYTYDENDNRISLN
ncbi:MAG: hypothetical protein NG740_01350 [Omnitrophica bacterium]|nr:hypothetical protein [Candidatus Omnitrophota bacterium]